MNISELVSELKQQRDELRVQFNLGKRELKDELEEEWDELQSKWDRFSARAELRETREEIREELDELADELKKGYRRIRDALKD